MERDELRALQAPLKERYRAEPEAATVTLAATGRLGDDKEAPVGFSAIRLTFDLDADATEDQLAALKKLTERYCVVYQTLTSAPQLTTELASTS